MIRDDSFFVVANGQLGVTAGTSENTKRIKVLWPNGSHSYMPAAFLRYAEKGETTGCTLIGRVYSEWREQQKTATKAKKLPRTAGNPLKRGQKA